MINYEEIDEKMRPIIKTLNDKGYITMYCCQGHYEPQYNCYWCTYLAFKDPLPNELCPIIEGYPMRDKIMSKMTTPYSDQKRNEIFYWYGDKHKRISLADKEKENDRLLKEILKWAENLP